MLPPSDPPRTVGLLYKPGSESLNGQACCSGHGMVGSQVLPSHMHDMLHQRPSLRSAHTQARPELCCMH
jgi:hypothetical protein